MTSQNKHHITAVLVLAIAYNYRTGGSVLLGIETKNYHILTGRDVGKDRPCVPWGCFTFALRHASAWNDRGSY
jgi:hypothetical protein